MERQGNQQLTTAENYYQLNFMMSLKGHYNSVQTSELAKTAVQKVLVGKDGFDNRIHRLIAEFKKPDQSSADTPDTLTPYLHAWDLSTIQALKTRYGGLLLALFHYGEHRHLLLDLASLGELLVAPVSARAYWDYFELREAAPENIANCLKLLEIENPRIGRELIGDLKKGRIGLIYVDGNMGADAVDFNEGTVSIPFMQQTIRAKSSIARISQALRIPILPVFARSADESNQPTVHFGSPIISALETDVGKQAQLSVTMQEIYSQLEAEIYRSPADWEYALYLNRWLDETNSTQPVHIYDSKNEMANISLANDETESSLTVNNNKVVTLEHQGQTVWFDVEAKTGYRPPEWWPDLFQTLTNKQSISIAAFKNTIPDSIDYEKLTEILNMLIHRKLLIYSAS